ncbi:MAG: hypothetical protein KDK91_10505 [Gammaproteobacteria bacterium]|nr:hypothetical protein [Gammaproteobacteria bacterium]
MAERLRMMINGEISEEDGRLAYVAIGSDDAPGGELTSLTRLTAEVHVVSSLEATMMRELRISLGRRKTGDASDHLLKRWRSGPAEHGESWVRAVKIYQIDDTKIGDDSIINIWHLEHVRLVRHCQANGMGTPHETADLVASGYQCENKAGALPDCPPEPIRVRGFVGRT